MSNPNPAAKMRLTPIALLLALAVPHTAGAQVSGQAGSGRPPQTAPVLPGGTVPGAAEPAPTATAAISGVVLDATTGAAVPDVLVYLAVRGRGTVGPQPRQLTDTKGRFAFVNLPAGTAYSIAASRFGYLDGGYVADGGPGASLGLIGVKDAEWVQNVRVSMWRPGAIGGTVVDEAGEPVVGVLVRVLPRFRMQGRDEFAAGPMTLTDDRGAYRLSGLGPGPYVVQVPSVQASLPMTTPLVAGRNGAVEAALELDADTRLVLSKYPLPPPPLNGRALAYPATFFPGTSAVAQAGVIDLRYGEDRSGVDLRLEPVTTSSVSGVIQGPAEAVASVILRLVPAGLEGLGQGSEAATTGSDAGGRFTFLNVPAGAYTLDATRRVSEFTTVPFSIGPGSGPGFPTPPGRRGYGRNSRTVDAAPPGTSIAATTFGGADTTYSGRTSVVVTAADVSNVVVTLRSGARIAGTFIVDADPDQAAPQSSPRLAALLDPAGGSPSLGLTQSSSQSDSPADEFEVSGLLPGEYWLRVPTIGWLVKSIQWRGKDYTMTPFDAAATSDISGVVVTVTNAVPTLAGAVRGQDGLPAAGATVLVFPTDRAQWTNFGMLPTRLRSTAVTNTGTFSLSTLPAGEYFVVAVTTPPAVWRDPELLAKAEALATRVTLSWGKPADVDLTTKVFR